MKLLGLIIVLMHYAIHQGILIKKKKKEHQTFDA